MDCGDIEANLTLEPEKTAVIVVDMQNDFLAEGAPLETPMGREFINELANLLDESRNAGAEVIYTAHVHREGISDKGTMTELCPPIVEEGALVDGTHGIEVHDEISPKEDEIVIKKHRFSGFYGTELDLILRNAGIENVVITGVTTHNCCAMTARDAQFRDYNAIFLADVTGTFEHEDHGFGSRSAQEIHETVCTIMSASAGTLATSEQVIEGFQ